MTPPPSPVHLIRSHTAALSTTIFNPANLLLYSADQDGWISVFDLRVRRVVCHWKAHEGGVLGLAEWQGGLISHGRDNRIHIHEPLRRPYLGRQPPSILRTLDVNSLNFCSFSLALCPRDLSVCILESSSGSNSALGDGSVSAQAFLAVPSLTDSELADIYHLPSLKRVHAAIGFSPAGKEEKKDRSGLIMGMHLAWRRGRLVLVMAFEDGRVELWRCAKSREGELWDARQSGDALWEKLFTGKGHNEAVMGLAVDANLDRAFTVSADHLLCKYELAQVLDENGKGKGKGRGALLEQVVSRYSTKQIGNSSVAISADGRVVAVGGWDGKIRLFSSATFKPLGTLSYHRETVHSLAFASPPLPLTSMPSDFALLKSSFTDSSPPDCIQLDSNRPNSIPLDANPTGSSPLDDSSSVASLQVDTESVAEATTLELGGGGDSDDEEDDAQRVAGARGWLANKSVWMIRHNAVKFPVGNALGSIPDTTTEFEPFIRHRGDGDRKNDIKFSGCPSLGLAPMEMDMAVASLQTGNASASYGSIAAKTDPVEDARIRAAAVLDTRAAQKVANLPPTLVPGATFHPMVFSAGGLVEKNTQNHIRNIGKKLPVGVYQFMLNRISIGLVKARTTGVIRSSNLQQLPPIVDAPHSQNNYGMHNWDDDAAGSPNSDIDDGQPVDGSNEPRDMLDVDGEEAAWEGERERGRGREGEGEEDGARDWGPEAEDGDGEWRTGEEQEGDLVDNRLGCQLEVDTSEVASIAAKTDPIEDAQIRAAAVLDAKAAGKIANLPPTLALGTAFHPMVFSAGGLMESGTQSLLRSIGKKLPAGAYQFMLNRISIGLARARATGSIRTDNLQQLPSPQIAPFSQNNYGTHNWDGNSAGVNGSEDGEGSADGDGDGDGYGNGRDGMRGWGEETGHEDDIAGEAEQGDGEGVENILGCQEEPDTSEEVEGPANPEGEVHPTSDVEV